MKRRFALLSPQGTACSETVLTEAEFADPELRARTERESCLGMADDPVPGTWTDVSDNEACWSGSPDPTDPDNFWIDDDTGERVNAHTGERTPARSQP